MESPQSPPPPDPPGSGPQAPPPAPQAPAGPQAPGPEAPPSGWEQPIAQQLQGAWAGRPLASWGSRLGAYIIDALIVGIPAFLIFLLFVGGAVIGDDSDTGFWVFVGSAILSTLVFAVLALIYAPTTMARQGEHNGQTWGKQMLGIRVLRDGGEPMSFWWAALREVGVKGLAVGIASSIIPFIPWFLNYFWPLWDDENRALHDMVVSTHVVKG
jgi:uncharacterized RDD family membrane protein YckC